VLEIDIRKINISNFEKRAGIITIPIVSHEKRCRDRAIALPSGKQPLHIHWQ
jgi:hypothetical protein